ncbi:AT-rich interactive domain-containing protein 2-like isoform X2 [Diospyros lotus]|uniref:AT-rich interactive domain-containing protein 2-like isoform X2 n=1 Tax=Diospyros lotus TaxID=55363 RepID=UPI0022593B05|nr:AT-rich interactive domain-containing protein 2-like isoform X2 [Diospyros lotus]
MVYKRPCHDEESFEVGFKHPRQEGHSAQQSPILGFLPSNDGPALSSGASNRFHESSASLDQSDPHIIPGDSSGSRVMDDDDNEAGLIGTCVIPMPDMESSAYSCCADRGRRSNCNCLDRGSIRCVRQHVMEAREELRENHLGQKAFEEFGFCDMGEEVARKWREDEEHTFRDVLSNAASQSKNIWDHLSATFPSRTKKELVSYYFNVFMLRKRAEQNRFDPLNVDSDNDECQKSKLVMTDKEDDTGGESLDKAPAHCQENSEEEFLKGIVEDSGAGTCKGDTNTVDTSCIMSNEEGGYTDDGL